MVLSMIRPAAPPPTITTCFASSRGSGIVTATARGTASMVVAALDNGAAVVREVWTKLGSAGALLRALAMVCVLALARTPPSVTPAPAKPISGVGRAGTA
jgi:hypothetical protein